MPPQPTPWANDPIIQSAAGGPLPSPPKPAETPPKPDLPTGWQIGPDGTAKPIPGLPTAAVSGLQPDISTPGDTAKTGDDYLGTLEPGLAGQVRALAEGRRAFPTGTALKDPKVQELIAAATQYDPALDASNAATRVGTRKDFTSGVTSRNVTAINTALGHLGSLSEAAGGLHNRTFPLWNTLANTAESAVGDPRVKNFTLARDAVANELMRVFRGTGGSLQEIEEWKNNISSSDSPDQLQAEIRKAVELLTSRLQAVGDQYNRGMGQSKDPMTLLSPHAQEVFASLTGGTSGGNGGNGGSGPTPPSLGPAGPMVNSGGQVAGNTHDNGANPGTEIAHGDTMRQDNPALAGVRAEYIKRLERGDSPDQLVAWAHTAGIDPSAETSIRAQANFRKAHPLIAIGEYDTSQLDDMAVPLTEREKLTGAAVDNPVGAAAVAAGDAASGFSLDNIIGATGGNAERARLAMNEIATRHPVASALGTMGGGVMASLGLEEAAGARLAPGMARGMVGDAAYGTAAGAGGTDYASDGTPATVQDRFIGAGKGALASAAGSYIGSKTAKAVSGIGRGVTDPSVTALRQEGITGLTAGQMYSRSGRVGKAVKGVEDRLSGLPVVGDMVNARRAEGYRQFNARAFDKALEPIGATVGDTVGEEAVGKAQDAVSQAFRDTLAGKGAVPDAPFVADLTSAVDGIRHIKRLGEEVTDEVAQILRPYADEQMLTGESLDDISRNLRQLRGAYRNDPLGHRVAAQVDRVEQAVFGLFDRQAAGTIEGYQAARAAYRRVSVLEDAVLRGKNEEGMFTPAQLGQADRRNSVKYDGKRGAARGEGVFHDYQRAAQNVLPNKVPDSGTAGRLLVPLALTAAGGEADLHGAGGTGLTIGTILAALYSKGGQRLLTATGKGMKPGIVRRVLESPKTGRALTAGTGASAAALETRQ